MLGQPPARRAGCERLAARGSWLAARGSCADALARACDGPARGSAHPWAGAVGRVVSARLRCSAAGSRRGIRLPLGSLASLRAAPWEGAMPAQVGPLAVTRGTHPGALCRDRGRRGPWRVASRLGAPLGGRSRARCERVLVLLRRRRGAWWPLARGLDRRRRPPARRTEGGGNARSGGAAGSDGPARVVAWRIGLDPHGPGRGLVLCVHTEAGSGRVHACPSSGAYPRELRSGTCRTCEAAQLDAGALRSASALMWSARVVSRGSVDIVCRTARGACGHGVDRDAARCSVLREAGSGRVAVLR
jgi:hypothetical protein